MKNNPFTLQEIRIRKIVKCLIMLNVFISLMTTYAFGQENKETLQSLAEQFKEPSAPYKPCTWWHWMGSNFSKEGITKDLECMKEVGIGGATIYNVTSSVQNTSSPLLNNPWPEQTYRGKAYWEAMKHAAAEAKRLGLTLGIHITPGYATTGGPWIDESRNMQKLVYSQTRVSVEKPVKKTLLLEKPQMPVYNGFSSTHKPGTYYKDIAVYAVPEKEDVLPGEVVDVSRWMDAKGVLKWQVPQGSWTIFRIGHAPTMSVPHPVPDDILGKVLEVDKMSREANIYFWKQALDPLTEHLKEYIGTTFTHIWVGSFESGEQDWTPTFRKEFIRLKGYDPLPWLAVKRYEKKTRADLKNFDKDYKDVISRLFIDNGWKTAREMVNKYGLQLYWEPYWSRQFDSNEAVFVPDIPVMEFWTKQEYSANQMPGATRKMGKSKVISEAFTGHPSFSGYIEDPAFLKHPADAGLVSGANWLYLHTWIHQPFDDKYQPGMSFGWWGTHFSRHQTWIKPGKAFFTYLSRCQMLLQHGLFSDFPSENIIHRTAPDADLFFIRNPSDGVVVRTFSFPVTNSVPELWDAYNGTIRQAPQWKEQDGSTLVDLRLEVDESVFVIFPKDKNCTYSGLKSPNIEVIEESYIEMDTAWHVAFEPKLAKPFQRDMYSLTDLSRFPEEDIKYFAGTATYEQTINIHPSELGNEKRILLSLGELHDIAELTVNKNKVSVLWCPPYKADITPYLKAGDNTITVSVTTNWVNRLIGDEQYPEDFEWGADRGTDGRSMKAFPDWFVNNQPRPSQERKTFTTWYYYRKDSPLKPAGLIGPVRLIQQNIRVMK